MLRPPFRNAIGRHPEAHRVRTEQGRGGVLDAFDSARWDPKGGGPGQRRQGIQEGVRLPLFLSSLVRVLSTDGLPLRSSDRFFVRDFSGNRLEFSGI